MGSTVTQIACGKRHTISLVASRGRIYGFGIGGSGQLGNKNNTNSPTPQIINGQWNNSWKKVMDSDSYEEGHIIIKRIFAGGDRCFVTASNLLQEVTQDLRLYSPKTQIYELTTDIANIIGKSCANEQIDLDFISMLEPLLKSLSCINGSFLSKTENYQSCSLRHPCLDLSTAQQAFSEIQKCENQNLNALVRESVSELIKTCNPSPPDVEVLPIYLLLPLYHEFINCKNYSKLHIPFGKAVLSLSKNPLKVVRHWWSIQSKSYFEQMIENYKSVIVYILNNQFMKHPVAYGSKHLVNNDPDIVVALNFVRVLYQINLMERSEKVPYDIFHLPELSENIDIKHEYINWVMDRNEDNFHICNYPFLFDAKAKTCLLQTDQAIQMHQAMQNAAAHGK